MMRCVIRVVTSAGDHVIIHEISWETVTRESPVFIDAHLRTVVVAIQTLVDICKKAVIEQECWKQIYFRFEDRDGGIFQNKLKVHNYVRSSLNPNMQSKKYLYNTI